MKPNIPEISGGNAHNLKMLRQAAINDDLALVVCYDKDTNTYVDAVCAVNSDPDAPAAERITMIPFALMNKTVPMFERLVPCTQPEDIEAAIEAAQKSEVCSPAERKWIEAQKRINLLEAHLIALAKGVRSKHMLLASKSPSTKYIDTQDLLLAIADEVESVINKV